MEEHTSNDNNDSAYQEKINSGDVSTNTSFSNYGKDYLVIDHGEQLQRHYEISHRDLQNQVQIMRSELTTLREVTIGLVFILAPLLAGWSALLVTRLFGYRSYELYAISVNIGMLAAVLLCDGPQFLDAFQRLFYHQEAPVVNQLTHESVESTSPASSTESVHFQGSSEQHHLDEDLASENMTADSVENLRAAVEEEDEEEDKETEID